MAPQNEEFDYPLLPPGVDSIRVLRLEPGNFSDPIVASLESVAFSQRPKYVALSYTWQSSYVDNAQLPLSGKDEKRLLPATGGLPNRRYSHEPKPTVVIDSESSKPPPPRISPLPRQPGEPNPITLNGQPFHIQHNLHLALLHLRSLTQALPLWADALCINQNDMAERNQQVALMNFIYTRATMVVAWLGTKLYTDRPDLFRAISLEWKAGQTQHLASAVARGVPIRSVPQPSQAALMLVAESSFWTRLWIVQEVCLPRQLVLAYGTDIWTYEDFRQWVLPPSSWHVPGVIEPMRTLIETREKRHSDMMSLESMIERFAKSKCSELRDRVYALLGCANDIRPFARQKDTADQLQDYLRTANAGSNDRPAPRRGMGFLQVDYSRSFFDIWSGVILFAFFQARAIDRPVRVERLRETAELDTNINLERCLSIVRTASLVQDALEQQVDEEEIGGVQRVEYEAPLIKAVGYIAGEIVELGPSYTSLIASASAYQEWTDCWVDHYQRAEDLETLRRINEEFLASLLSCEQEAVDRTRNLHDPRVKAWKVVRGTQIEVDLDLYPDKEGGEAGSAQVDDQEPRICLGTNCVMGLAPPAARPGDVIIRFWGCDAAMVMRPYGGQTKRRDLFFRLVGRASVANLDERFPSDNAYVPKASSASKYHGLVYVDLNIQTLQRITAHTRITSDNNKNTTSTTSDITRDR